MHYVTDRLDRQRYTGTCPLQMPEELNSNLSTSESQQPLQPLDLSHTHLYPPIHPPRGTPPRCTQHISVSKNLWWQHQLVLFKWASAAVFIHNYLKQIIHPHNGSSSIGVAPLRSGNGIACFYQSFFIFLFLSQKRIQLSSRKGNLKLHTLDFLIHWRPQTDVWNVW